jgi:dolichol-phosphate mannosyltransferase
MVTSKSESVNAQRLTVILPVINEYLNLQILIPELLGEFEEADYSQLEIIIVDDGSIDETEKFITDLEMRNQYIHYLKRTGTPSLPKSIWDGISMARTEYIAWMDADGSMSAKTLKQLWEHARLMQDGVIVASRFLNGGGFKGINIHGETKWLNFVRNVNSSKDSLIAVLLSRCLNVFLRLLLPVGVKDMTSGFAVTKRIFLEEQDFQGEYGDYFPRLVTNKVLKRIPVWEIPYICIPRMHGESKTGNTIMKLIGRGRHYMYFGICNSPRVWAFVLKGGTGRSGS